MKIQLSSDTSCVIRTNNIDDVSLMNDYPLVFHFMRVSSRFHYYTYDGDVGKAYRAINVARAAAYLRSEVK